MLVYFSIWNWWYVESLRKAYCVVHDRECSICDNIAHTHIAGTPCTAYSTAGLMDAETAESYAHFLCWAGLRRKTQEPVIVQECTDGFPRSEFDKLLPMYAWSFAILDPITFGWPVRRRRQWCVYLGKWFCSKHFNFWVEQLNSNKSFLQSRLCLNSKQQSTCEGLWCLYDALIRVIHMHNMSNVSDIWKHIVNCTLGKGTDA